MKNKILIVDDADISRDILSDLLEDTYEVLQAENGQVALRMLQERNNEIAAVLLDLKMPEMDGYAVCEYLKEKGIIRLIPVIVLTGDISIESEMRCFDLGVFDYIRKPFSNVLLMHRVENAVFVHEKRVSLEGEVQKQNELLKKAVERLRTKSDGLQAEVEEFIEVLGSMGEYRTMDTDVHIRQMKAYTRILGERYRKLYPDCGLTEESLQTIVMCSPLHNIGKIELPERVILKPGKLTRDEYDLMKSHTVRGCEMLKNIHTIWNSEYAKVCQDICRYHHERYDGKGYPDGLSGEFIPVSAQLVGIADVYDALLNDTTYRAALSKEKAFSMILGGECGVFSPKLLEAFRQSREELEAVQK